MGGDSKTSSGDTSSEKLSLLETMYQFRDQVLRKSLKGQEYADLYYEHASEASVLLLKDGGLRDDTRDVLSKIVPLLGKAIQGEQVKLTSKELSSGRKSLGYFCRSWKHRVAESHR